MNILSFALQVFICLLYVFASTIASQILHDTPTFGEELPSVVEKIAAAAVVYTPLALYILSQLSEGSRGV